MGSALGVEAHAWTLTVYCDVEIRRVLLLLTGEMAEDSHVIGDV